MCFIIMVPIHKKETLKIAVVAEELDLAEMHERILKKILTDNKRSVYRPRKSIRLNTASDSVEEE